MYSRCGDDDGIHCRLWAWAFVGDCGFVFALSLNTDTNWSFNRSAFVLLSEIRDPSLFFS